MKELSERMAFVSGVSSSTYLRRHPNMKMNVSLSLSKNSAFTGNRRCFCKCLGINTIHSRGDAFDQLARASRISKSPRASPLRARSRTSVEDCVNSNTSFSETEDIYDDKRKSIVTGALNKESSSDVKTLTAAANVDNNVDLELEIENRLDTDDDINILSTLRRTWAGPGGEERRKKTEKLVTNIGALLVAGSLAFAFFVTVDEERWRGWTVWEVLTRIPLSNWERYSRNVIERPLITKSIISGFVYSIGDLLAQQCESVSLPDLDVKRILRSGIVGLAFQAPIYHYYYEITESILPTDGGFVNAVAKIVLDQTITIATWNALYYLILGAMTKKPFDESIDLIKKSAWPLMVNGWKLWPAAHILTYTVIPTEHRLLYVDVIEIIWVVILSFTASQMSSDEEELKSSLSSEESISLSDTEKM